MRSHAVLSGLFDIEVHGVAVLGHANRNAQALSNLTCTPMPRRFDAFRIGHARQRKPVDRCVLCRDVRRRSIRGQFRAQTDAWINVKPSGRVSPSVHSCRHDPSVKGCSIRGASPSSTTIITCGDPPSSGGRQAAIASPRLWYVILDGPRASTRRGCWWWGSHFNHSQSHRGGAGCGDDLHVLGAVQHRQLTDHRPRQPARRGDGAVDRDPRVPVHVDDHRFCTVDLQAMSRFTASAVTGSSPRLRRLRGRQAWWTARLCRVRHESGRSRRHRVGVPTSVCHPPGSTTPRDRDDPVHRPVLGGSGLGGLVQRGEVAQVLPASLIQLRRVVRAIRTPANPPARPAS